MYKVIEQLAYTANNYSPRLAAMKVITSAFNSMGKRLNKYPTFPYRYAANLVEKQLASRYQGFLDEWKTNHSSETAHTFSSKVRIPIWTCWLQDLSTMPPLLQHTTHLQQIMSCDYDFRLISYSNIHNYLDFPGYIMDKLHSGVITPVHFTDLIRVSLLEEYGGVWLDATVLPVRTLPNSLFQTPFYTIKSPKFTFASSNKYPEINRWEGYFIAGQPHALLYKWMKDFLFEYWKKENFLIHYLMINQAALLGIDYIPLIRSEYDALHQDNHSVELLGNALDTHQYTTLDDYTSDGTYVFKLSRHTDYRPQDLRDIYAQIAQHMKLK